MRRMRRVVLALGILWLAVPLPAFAFVRVSGQAVTFNERLDDDLYIAGGTVEVRGNVNGDVVAAGGTVGLFGPLSGGALVGGGTVTVGGPVGRSVRAAGGTVTLEGRTAADAVVAGGTISVEPGAVIGRDLVAAGGKLHVSGSVGRNALLSGGTIVISGRVGGDVDASAGEIILLPTGRIQGRLRYAADQGVEIQPGAQVAGGVERIPLPPAPQRIYPAAFGFFGRVLELLWLLAIGVVALLAAPRGVTRVVERVRTQFGPSLLTGFVLMVVVPVAALVVAFTVVGIALSAIGVLLYLATLYAGQIFTAAWLGDRILHGVRRGPGATVSPYATLILGTIVLVVLVTVPFVGWLIRLVALAVGFGALWAAVWATRRVRHQPSPA